MTLQATLNHLTTLARDAGVEMTTQLSLQAGGAVLTVYWTPEEDIAREATLVFGPSPEDQDAFLFAYVVAPEIWLHLIDEGVEKAQADDMARRWVETVDDVARYLVGASYAWTKPGEIQA